MSLISLRRFHGDEYTGPGEVFEVLIVRETKVENSIWVKTYGGSKPKQFC